jgi:hypothetical protein
MNPAQSLPPTPYPIPLFQLLEKSCWWSHLTQIVVLDPVSRYDHASRAEADAEGGMCFAPWRTILQFWLIERLRICSESVSYGFRFPIHSASSGNFRAPYGHYSIQRVTCAVRRDGTFYDGRTDVEPQDPGSHPPRTAKQADCPKAEIPPLIIGRGRHSLHREDRPFVDSIFRFDMCLTV